MAKRLHLDLLGILPPPETVQEFVESTDPAAYERLVDRLLASPHFGERWGRHWLDGARYADSDGYEKDRPRPLAWRYREWVIDAINRDLSFRDFSIEQLAGDLLSDPSGDSLAATGFHRNTLHNTEGGIDPEEDRVKKTVDRTNTVGTLWLGMTVGCAQCHSHKYDPVSQREYFQLYAFFNQIEERDLPAALPRDRIESELALLRWKEREHRLLDARERVGDSVATRFERWVAHRPQLPIWQDLPAQSVRSVQQARFQQQADGSWLAQGENRVSDTYEIISRFEKGETLSAIRLEALPDGSLPKGGPGRAENGNFVLTDVRFGLSDPAAEETLLAVATVTADFSQNDWQAAKTINQDLDDGWAISPEIGKRHVVVFELAEPVEVRPGQQLRIVLSHKYSGKSHNLGRFRLSFARSEMFFPLDDIDEPLAKRLAQGESPSADERNRLFDFYRSWDPLWQAATVDLENHRAKRPDSDQAKVQAVVERSSPRETLIHLRGDFLSPGEAVSPQVPAVLPPLSAAERRPNRLDFARWLFSDEHPLTARVEVNRVWMRLFGRGLVTTSDDFGTQGEPPEYPELLDWLATEFRNGGWGRKRLIRTIVTSSIYRQRATMSPEQWQRDPENRLLARQNRLRLEAEVIRDISLLASGLLDERVGGPSVRPPQPEGYSALTYADSAKWEVSAGGDAYRRGLYIFFQRTSPYPMLMAFDCPDANQSTVVRNTSNTPLQALTLWNERVFFECHQAMAERLLREVPAQSGKPESELNRNRLELAGWLTLGRQLRPEESERLNALREQALRVLVKEPAQARRLIGESATPGPPEETSESWAQQASWVLVCRTLMNLDEFITRE